MLAAQQHAIEVRRRLFNLPAPARIAIPIAETVKVEPEAVIDIDPDPISPLPLTVRAVVRAVCDFYDITEIDIRGKGRSAWQVRPRHVAMYLARRLTGRSYPQIGDRLGRRDHTSVLNGVRRIERLIGIDREIADEVAYIASGLPRE